MQNQLIPIELIENKIYVIRGHKVMLDSDLALLYEVETRIINRDVKRNIERFPEEFMFQLSDEEWANLRSQIGISNKTKGGRRYNPYVFTEHGVLMLSNVLGSLKAIAVSIQIIKVFTKLRQLIIQREDIPHRLSEIEKLLMLYMEKTDGKIEEIIQVLNYLIEHPKETEKIGFRIEE